MANTAYGRSLKIDQSRVWDAIPLVTYKDLVPWVDQQKQQPQAKIITPERIHFWEQTSGSTGASKCIPYTSSLIASFTAMFCVWLDDLIQHGPPFSTGKTYLCISPQIGTGLGGTDDTAFLDGFWHALLDRFIIRTAKQFETTEQFRWALATALSQAEDLEILSLWSPSFLTVQLEFIQSQAKQLQTILKNKMSTQRLKLFNEPIIPWTELWPELKLISCWDRMHAADQASTLQRYFPGVFIQGKGLLATEGPITIPLISAQGFVPMLNQVVLEFLDSHQNIKTIAELDKNTTYEVILSQSGGLCRYQIGDRVQVSHWYKNTPCLEFVGRGSLVSDLVGEKLTESFVSQLLSQLQFSQASFCCLVPVETHPPHYCLCLDQSSESITEIMSKLEAALQTNVHYRHARSLGQLDSVDALIHPQIIELFQCHGRMGDRKLPLLQTKSIKPEKFSLYSARHSN